jgi:hypothetical protein
MDGESDGLVAGCHCNRTVHAATTASNTPDMVFHVIMNASEMFGRFTALVKRRVHWKHTAIISIAPAACNRNWVEKNPMGNGGSGVRRHQPFIPGGGPSEGL